MNAAGLFQRLLGTQYERLAPRVRQVHGGASQRLRGTATVTRGDAVVARLICRAAGLPAPQRDGPVRIDLDVAVHGETWTRHFGASRPMRSHLQARDALLVERLGPLRLCFRLRESGGAVVWQLQALSVLGIPAPRRWLTMVKARSAESAGRYTFDVQVVLPLIGHVIGYQGSVSAGALSSDCVWIE